MTKNQYIFKICFVAIISIFLTISVFAQSVILVAEIPQAEPQTEKQKNQEAFKLNALRLLSTNLF